MLTNDAEQLFRLFRTHPQLTWTHNNTGCESRADLMAELAAGKGLQPSKIWIQIAPGTEGFFGIYLNESRTELSYCKYHVAIVLDVDGEDRVFDPGFFAVPVSRKVWRERLSTYCHEYGHQVRVMDSDWRNFYGPEQMIWNREQAIEDRSKLLALSRDLDDGTVFEGTAAKARGEWADGLRTGDPRGFEQIRDAGRRSPFGLWFRRTEQNDKLEQWLQSNEKYFGISSDEVLASVDFSDRLAAVEVRKRYWRPVFDVFAALSRRRDELLDGTSSSAILFRSLWGDSAEDRAKASAEWFAPGSQSLWERFDVDF